MKIMFVIPKMTGGGAERVVANLCNYWCEDNDVRIVAIASRESFYKLNRKVELCGRELIINRKNFLTTLECYLKNYSKSVRFIKKNIEEFNPDCVISFLVEADLLTYRAVRKNKDVIKVFSERNDPTKRGIVKRLLLKTVYKNADLFVCQGRKVYDYYSYIQNNKKIIIPNPLDEKVLPSPTFDELNHNIVSIGRLFEQKNFRLLINSFTISVKEIPEDSNLIIYGNGPMRKDLQELINKNGMEKRIELRGACKNVLNEAKNAALFVLSSNYEGFPNALVEAMAVGLPVISTDFYTGIAKELVKEQNGIITPVNNASEMSEALIKIMGDKALRKKMRKNNILVRGEFNIDKIGDLWIDAIKGKMI